MRRHLKLWIDALAYALIGAIVIFAWLGITIADAILYGQRKLKWS